MRNGGSLNVFIMLENVKSLNDNFQHSPDFSQLLF